MCWFESPDRCSPLSRFLNSLDDISGVCLHNKLLAMFFLKEPIGGHPTTGPDGILQTKDQYSQVGVSKTVHRYRYVASLDPEDYADFAQYKMRLCLILTLERVLLPVSSLISRTLQLQSNHMTSFFFILGDPSLFLLLHLFDPL